MAPFHFFLTFSCKSYVWLKAMGQPHGNCLEGLDRERGGGAAKALGGRGVGGDWVRSKECDVCLSGGCRSILGGCWGLSHRRGGAVCDVPRGGVNGGGRGEKPPGRRGQHGPGGGGGQASQHRRRGFRQGQSSSPVTTPGVRGCHSELPFHWKLVLLNARSIKKKSIWSWMRR